MGSHYIQVGKLKIDKEILDLACPAAGYGETPPDPAIYCPANGFTEPEEVWESPVITPAPSNQEILLICSDFYEGGLAIRTKMSAGATKIEVLNSSMSVLSTFTASGTVLTTINIDFPTLDTGAIYIIRLSPTIVTGTFLEFRTAARTGFVGDWMILEAKFNTPNMQKLEYAFQNVTNFKLCTFYSEMNSLTTLYQAFGNTSIERVDGIKVFPQVTTAAYIFQYTKFKTIDLSSWNMPNASLAYAFQSSKVEEVTLSNTSGGLAKYTFENTPLRKLNVPADYSLSAGITDIRYCFASTPNFEGTDLVNKAITIRGIEAITNATQMFYNSAAIKKIIFEGNMDLCTNMSSMCNGCASLEELIMPSSMDAMNTTGLNNGLYRLLTNTKRLKRFILPLSMSSWYLGWTNAVIPNANIIEELGTCNVYSDVQQTVWLYGTRWKKISQPTLKLSRLIVGDSLTIACNDLQEFDFDFENSLFDPMPTTAIVLYTTNLTAAQLNALFHRLPDYTGQTVRRLNCLANIGWNDSDKTILSAKNWTW